MTLEKLIEKLQSAEKQNEELSMKIAQLEAQIAWFKKHGNAKGVSPRILTKLACMEEPDGLIW